jgi:hypothetical protein
VGEDTPKPTERYQIVDATTLATTSWLFVTFGEPVILKR